MKVQKFVVLSIVSQMILNSLVAVAQAESSVDPELSVLVLDFSLNAQDASESEPLSPQDYYPLGMGVRKNGDISLIPFCVAKNPRENSCTYAQYFEVKSGHYSDSDRAMDITHGAPEGRITGQKTPFHGRAIGKPFSGYVFSGGGYEEFVQKYVQSFDEPEEHTYEEVLDCDSCQPAFQVFAFATIGALVGGAIWSGKLDDLGGPGMGMGAAAGAAIPFAVALVRYGSERHQLRKFKRNQVRTESRILDAFSKSKRLRENWTLINGLKVSSKTYDAFVEFLNAAQN